MKIVDVLAREILDSRGNPTVEVEVTLEDGSIGRFSVPSGASTGRKEALELRDDDEKRYFGKGVLKAVDNVNHFIREHLIGMDSYQQEKIDLKLIELDGTLNKSRLGANAILGVSGAVLKASAISKKMPLFRYVGNGEKLPVLMINILNGGKHADNNLSFQEFLIVPIRDRVRDSIRLASEVFHSLKAILKEKKMVTSVGDEGGFAPNVSSNLEALDLIMNAIVKAGYRPFDDVKIALDAAASEFYHDGVYLFDGRSYSREELIDYYCHLIEKYPIVSIEDPVYEDDFEGFHILTEKIGDKVQLVGDDLFATNREYLQKGIDNRAGNAILLKPNQVGTITEMIETIELARKHHYNMIISHRSGETEDTTIADLAVGLSIPWIKTGSMSRSERVCKYNQLIRIEEELDPRNRS